jgi:hypothetical protein
MAASRRGASKTLLQLYPQLEKGIQQARRDILGHLPAPTAGSSNARTGYNKSTKQLKEVYLNQYYMEPIDKIARQVREREGDAVLYFLVGKPPWENRPCAHPLLGACCPLVCNRSNLDLCGITRSGDESSSCSYVAAERDRPKRARAVRRKSRFSYSQGLACNLTVLYGKEPYIHYYYHKLHLTLPRSWFLSTGYAAWPS